MEELYNALVEQGKYTKSFEDFKVQFGEPEKTKLLYDALNSSEITLNLLKTLRINLDLLKKKSSQYSFHFRRVVTDHYRNHAPHSWLFGFFRKYS